MMMLMPSQHLHKLLHNLTTLSFEISVSVSFFGTGQLSESPFLMHPKDNHTAGFYQVFDSR